jgi:hypothetical protein
LSVSLIEVAVGVLDDLERFGQFAESIDRRILQLRRIEALHQRTLGGRPRVGISRPTQTPTSIDRD